MLIKTKIKNKCLVCKQKLKKGEEITIVKNGVVIHSKGCVDKLKKYVESIQEK